LHYGPEILDGWLVDQVDAGAVQTVQAGGITCRAIPLMMSSVAATAEMAKAALTLANEVAA
jgi:LPPG:FO 2-phospho-L-lactate transferase